MYAPFAGRPSELVALLTGIVSEETSTTIVCDRHDVTHEPVTAVTPTQLHNIQGRINTLCMIRVSEKVGA